jgi:hypothetical protein
MCIASAARGAGMSGFAISLVGPEEEAHLRLIEKKVDRRIARVILNQ